MCSLCGALRCLPDSEHNGGSSSHAEHNGMSSSNPKPCDLNKAVVVVDGDEMRLRRADEQTEAGHEVEHHLFIVCCNIGVRKMGELSTPTLAPWFD